MNKNQLLNNEYYEWLHLMGLYETRYILYWWHRDEPWDVDEIDKSYE